MNTMKMQNNILPDDIILFHILPKLPNRSLGRFTCVCKQWRSFLTTHVFTKMHLHHVNNQNSHKMIVVSTTNPCNYFQTMDCEAPEVGLSAKRSLPFEVGSNTISIISSLNGLICLGISRPLLYDAHKYLDIILWNPLTGDYKTLSKGNCFTSPPIGYGLYYSCSDDDYKLLCVTQSNESYIYSWKSESWRKAKSRVDLLVKGWQFGCLVSEKLYFLARGTQGGLIIMFDTKTEMLTEIATPPCKCYHMTVVKGCIHLWAFPKGDSYRVELWKMERDGEWMKVIRSCRSMFMYLPWHLMRDGNWLMQSIFSQALVYKADRKMHKKAKKVCHFTTSDGSMDILWKGRFVETIVSLNR